MRTWGGREAPGIWHLGRKLAAGSIVAGVLVASAGAGTASASPHHRSRGSNGPGGRVGGPWRHRDGVAVGVVGTVGTNSFTITRGIGSVTVDVTGSTTYVERGQSSAGVSNVVSGERVLVAGAVTSPGVLTATRVVIETPDRTSVDGVVQSLASDSSSFTITRGFTTITVDVSGTTTYTLTGGASASFASLAVGDRVEVKGTVGQGAFDATQVVISAPPMRAILGTVAGVGTTGDSFTITVGGDAAQPITVNVTSSTVYLEKGVSGTGFSNVAQGDQVVVVGSVGSGAFDASTVVILSTSAPA